MQVQRGLPESQRLAAAALYWQAFGGKLGTVLGPTPRALAYLHRVMQMDQCFAAMEAGRLIGVLGISGPTGSFAGGNIGDLRAVYGGLGGLWRWPLLVYVGGAHPQAGVMMIEGFAVDGPARGQGVGAALLRAAMDHARATGHRDVALDVAVSNWRARSFYARHGFAAGKARPIWPLGAVFGISGVARMTRALD